jgi:thioredoxin-dependent peroxiredoxin
MLNVGDKAPKFSLPSDSGDQVSLGTFKGKRVVLFFFPKADTPG